MTELRSETKKRQDEMRDLGRAAGKHASPQLQDYLKKKHCLSDDEEAEFDRGVREGQQEAE